MTLHNLGVEGVHPLRGGYDEWKKLGFPLAPATTTSPIVKSLQVVYAAILPQLRFPAAYYSEAGNEDWTTSIRSPDKPGTLRPRSSFQYRVRKESFSWHAM